MLNLFSPHGSNPLGNVKLSNQRCARVDFDRTVKCNVLTMEGDLTQSKMQLPREDRAVASLQLIHPLLCLQLWIPNSGQFMLELGVAHSSTVKMKLTCGTHISKPDVHDVKGIAHVKLPLAIPRGSWTQVVFHVPGIFSHLFGLPQVRWVDTVAIGGNVKLKRILVTSEEQLALESRPAGMLLYTLPAYGPPLWSGKCGVAQTEKPPAAETATPPPETPPPPPEGIKMRFVRGEDGGITFSATSQQLEREKRLAQEREEEERLLTLAREDEEERQRLRQEEVRRIQQDRRDYVRLLESPTAPAPPRITPKKTRQAEPSPVIAAEDAMPMGWDSEDDVVLGSPSGPAQQLVTEPKVRQSVVPRKAAVTPAATKKPSVQAETSRPKPKKKKMKIASLVTLHLEEPLPVHPADTYDPQAKESRPVGFGVGCLDVIESPTSPDSSSLESPPQLRQPRIIPPRQKAQPVKPVFVNEE